jgi:deoxyribonuclease IV
MSLRFMLGMKVWSTNTLLIPEIVKFYREGRIDYIELTCIPDSFKDTASKWSTSGLSFVIHAPHSMLGLNFSREEMEHQNARLALESLRMADALEANAVIFHPGTNGSTDETIRQVKKIHDSRMILENKPYRGLDGSVCVGSLPVDLKLMCSVLNLRFCLDFGHAIASANSHQINVLDLISEFVQLKPMMYHLTDGLFDSELDHHEMYGKGTFPLKQLMGFIPNGAHVTDEAKRRDNNCLDDFFADREWIENNV